MRTRGFVVKKSDYGEYDQLITFYTENFGKITGIAKSVTKPDSKQASHLDVLNLVDFSLISGNGYPIITSAVSISTNFLIKKSLPALAVSSFLLEIIDKAMYSHDPDSNLWDFFVKSFDYLNDISPHLKPVQYEPIFLNFKNQALYLLGYSDFKKTDTSLVLEEIFQRQFGSLQFLKNVIK